MHPLFEALRRRLHERPGRALNLPGLELREAAVLVPFVLREGEPHLIFTRRPRTLRSHAGQFAFPGGSRDPEDETPLHTALREAKEELAIPPERVAVLGSLDESPTVTNFRIMPFGGVVPEDVVLVPSPEEIDLVVEIPLREMLRPGGPRRVLWKWEGENHPVFYFDWGEHTIWGATARIVVDLFERAEGVPEFEALR